MANRKLRRIPPEGKIGGVCAGFAYWLAAPLWVVRLICVILILFMGWGLILYLLFWIFMPKLDYAPKDFAKVVE